MQHMRRVFVDTDAPHELARGLTQRGGIFVPTRLELALGDQIVVAVRPKGASRVVEIGAEVLGRRAPRGARGILSTGVLVRAMANDDPMLELLNELGAGGVVDIESRIRERSRVAACATFETVGELRAEITRLLEGAPAVFTLDRTVAPGDRLSLVLSTDELRSWPPLEVEVRGVVNRDGEPGCRAVLFSDAGRRVAETLLEGPGLRVVHGGASR